jgi:hypothetical protein
MDAIKALTITDREVRDDLLRALWRLQWRALEIGGSMGRLFMYTLVLQTAGHENRRARELLNELARDGLAHPRPTAVRHHPARPPSRLAATRRARARTDHRPPYRIEPRMTEKKCPYNGPDCDNGWLWTAHNTQKECQCEIDRRHARRVRNLGRVIPPEFVHVDFDRTPIKDLAPSIQKTLRAYVKNIALHVRGPSDELPPEKFDAAYQHKGKGLWFFSEKTGNGKTSAAALIAKKASEAHLRVIWNTVPELLERIRRSYDDTTALDHEQTLDALKAVDLLVLDDLAAVNTTDWVREQLYVIVNARWESKLPVIVTSDMSARKITDEFDRRIVSRLIGICGKPIEFTADDQRVRGAWQDAA